MPVSLKKVFDYIKRDLGLPSRLKFLVIDRRYGITLSQRKEVVTRGLESYLANVSDSTRVGAFLPELERLVGAQVGAKIEIWYAGNRIDGRRSIAGLR